MTLTLVPNIYGTSKEGRVEAFLPLSWLLAVPIMVPIFVKKNTTTTTSSPTFKPPGFKEGGKKQLKMLIYFNTCQNIKGWSVKLDQTPGLYG